ncbi:hypothetical protein B0H16DRAFT_260362 [Mycena metata]|uniref:Uncharacterized protein n=1 Tax=Mycena metata TaxID=1033252 RepID=A0AAD7MPL2_9AGAR|nr:hypothetical protein B0H16DRAFT_260362 [Mycena metata]
MPPRRSGVRSQWCLCLDYWILSNGALSLQVVSSPLTVFPPPKRERERIVFDQIVFYIFLLALSDSMSQIWQRNDQSSGNGSYFNSYGRSRSHFHCITSIGSPRPSYAPPFP